MKILIADKVSAQMVADLKTLGCDVTLEPDVSADALPAAIAGVEVLIVRSKQVTAATIEAGTSLSLSDSWGLAGHVGIDFKLGEKAALRVDYRTIDIDTKVKLNGANLGTKNTVNIDPSVYGIAYVFSF